MNGVITGRFGWPEYAEMLQKWGLDEANARGFTVRHGDVDSSVDIPGGLAEEHYNVFAPHLSDEDKAELARGVLLNMARMALGSDNPILQDHVLRDFDSDFLDALPTLVEAQGFAGIASLVKEKVAAFRQANPKKTPPERACLFQRFQVSESYFLRVRFVWEGNVEEATVEESVGMVYLRLLLQYEVRQPSTVRSWRQRRFLLHRKH